MMCTPYEKRREGMSKEGGGVYRAFLSGDTQKKIEVEDKREGGGKRF